MGFEGSGTTTRIQSSLDKSQKGQFRKQKSRRRRTTTYYHMRPAREKRKEQRPWAKRWAYDLGALRRRASTGIGWRGEHGWRDVRWKRAGEVKVDWPRNRRPAEVDDGWMDGWMDGWKDGLQNEADANERRVQRKEPGIPITSV
ncbi:hypothetical protein IAQ61_001692 [Plenodomus lingam]|uniref:uncharacterized protein n=1 Tax=Leptosphaeria maculans TaxID=5022 RepID=UPI00332B128F|nr:hypothetical protein IAQ61_001692 [Plenodomus lingam]